MHIHKHICKQKDGDKKADTLTIIHTHAQLQTHRKRERKSKRDKVMSQCRHSTINKYRKTQANTCTDTPIRTQTYEHKQIQIHT